MIRLLDKVINLVYESMLGITTRGVEGVGTSDAEHIHYGTVPYRTIRAILNALRLGSGDIFVDLGCGKGRVLCCASMRKPARSIGIEYAPSLADSARNNAAALRAGHSAIDVKTMEAQQFDFTEGNVFYMFHPFGEHTMREVMNRLKDGLERSPRLIRIVYLNPVHADVLREYSWLIEYEHWAPGFFRSPEHQVCWFKNRADK